MWSIQSESDTKLDVLVSHTIDYDTSRRSSPPRARTPTSLSWTCLFALSPYLNEKYWAAVVAQHSSPVSTRRRRRRSVPPRRSSCNAGINSSPCSPASDIISPPPIGGSAKGYPEAEAGEGKDEECRGRARSDVVHRLDGDGAERRGGIVQEEGRRGAGEDRGM